MSARDSLTRAPRSHCGKRRPRAHTPRRPGERPPVEQQLPSSRRARNAKTRAVPNSPNRPSTRRRRANSVRRPTGSRRRCRRSQARHCATTTTADAIFFSARRVAASTVFSRAAQHHRQRFASCAPSADSNDHIEDRRTGIRTNVPAPDRVSTFVWGRNRFVIVLCRAAIFGQRNDSRPCGVKIVRLGRGGFTRGALVLRLFSRRRRR